jgi:hypothetical protein
VCDNVLVALVDMWMAVRGEDFSLWLLKLELKEGYKDYQ